MGRNLTEEKVRFEKALNAEAQRTVDAYEASNHHKLSSWERNRHTDIVKAIVYDKFTLLLNKSGGKG